MTDRSTESYLAALRRRVAWRSDAADILAEVEDHLASSVERLQAAGMRRVDAERATVARFGEPAVVARAFATTVAGGLAVPTRFTRSAGTVAIVTALLWLSVAVAWWAAGLTEPRGYIDSTASTVAYVIGAGSLLVAIPLTVLVMVALQQRHGGLGVVGQAGIALAGVAAVGGLAAWVMVGWGAFGIVGMALFGGALLDRDVTPRIPTLALTSGLACGGIAWVALHALPGNPVAWGFWGEDWLANEIALTVAALPLAYGLTGLGRWLRREEVAALDVPDRRLPA